MVSEIQEETVKPGGPFLRQQGEPLELFDTVRLRFFKVGHLQYISHLDLQRSMMRILVRAGIPVWYTQGFNPHAKVVFALPLPIGVQSRCEYMDVRLDRKIEFEEVKRRLNAALTDEMQVLEAYAPEMKFSDIGYAAYTIRFTCPQTAFPTAGEVEACLRDPGTRIRKKTKSGEHDVATADVIEHMEIESTEEELRLDLLLSAGTNRETLSPAQIAEEIENRFSLYKDPAQEHLDIIRTSVLNLDGVPFR